MQNLKRKHWVLFFFSISWIGLILSLSCSSNKTSLPVTDENHYVGSTSCKSCHTSEYEEWQESHHFFSMQEASDETVLGNFNNAEVVLNGITSRFYQKEGKFFIHTQGEDGKPGDYEVKYTFGYHPLQQYLTEMEDGKIQAFRLAWDEIKKEWFHLNPELNLDPKEWLYWTNRSMNWNSMCSECHSTNLKKEFNDTLEFYSTHWDEINVGCESCHGPGHKHIELVSDEEFSKQKESIDLYVKMTNTQPARAQVEQCAPCHARRSTISDDYTPGDPMFDHYVPDILRTELYYDDGQIDDEVFVYGSFAQSKMFKQGVKCSDCHRTHSLELKFQGNDLCLQCHAPTYALEEHHFHKAESAECIDCHMTGKLYMVNDYRRDHSFRIPRPDLSVKYDNPNACNTCHSDQSAEWAASAIDNWYGKERPFRDVDLLVMSRNGEFDSLEVLIHSITSDTISPIIRATIINSVQGSRNPEILMAINQTLKDPEPMVRIESIRYFGSFPTEERKRYLLPALQDSMRTVRVTAVELLTGISANSLPQKYQSAFAQSLLEYEYYLQYNSDFKSGQLKLGNYHDIQGKPDLAEKAFKKAVEIDPLYNPARLNLSLVYNKMGRNSEALDLYNTVIALEPDYGPVYFSAGLLLAEMNRIEEAAEYLEKSVEKDPENLRAYYNLGIIYQNLGKTEDAERIYLAGLSVQNDYPELHHAITVLYLQTTRYREARKHLSYLISRFPENRQYLQWSQEIDERLN